jgi:hypothetical protein
MTVAEYWAQVEMRRDSTQSDDITPDEGNMLANGAILAYVKNIYAQYQKDQRISDYMRSFLLSYSANTPTLPLTLSAAMPTYMHEVSVLVTTASGGPRRADLQRLELLGTPYGEGTALYPTYSFQADQVRIYAGGALVTNLTVQYIGIPAQVDITQVPSPQLPWSDDVTYGIINETLIAINRRFESWQNLTTNLQLNPKDQ